jgi:PAS domain S-box-containing protein
VIDKLRERILGLTSDQICGKKPTDPDWRTIHEDGSPFPGAEHPAMVVLRTGVPQWDVAMGVVVPGEGTRWINVRAEPLRGADGKVTGAVATFADVTLARQREADLLASRAQLAHVLEGGSDGFWDWDIRTGRAHFSARMSAMLGGPGVATDGLSSSWPERVDPAQRDRITERLATIAAGEVDHIDAEYRVRTAAGAWKWIRSKGRVVAHDRDGKPTRFAGTVSDITEFKEVGDRLRRSEALHRAIAGSIPGGAVFLADESLRIVLADGPALAQEGISGRDLEGQLATDLVLPGGITFDGSQFRAAFGGERSHFELPLGERTYAIEVGPVRDEEGKIFLAAAAAVDVTRLKAAEEALRRSRDSLARRHEMLAMQSRDAILFVRAADGRILDANPASVALYGYSREELLGMTNRDLRPPGSDEDVGRQIAAATAGSVLFEAVQRRKDGSTFPVEVSSSSAEVDGERILVGVVRDITRRRRAEQELAARRELLDAVVKDLPVGALLFRGSDLVIQVANPAYQALAPDRELVGRSILEVWPEARAQLEDRIRRVLESGEPFEARDERFLLRRTPGGSPEERFFTWSLRRVRLPGDEGFGVLTTTWETTERRAVEAGAKEAANWLTLALESADAGTWEWDLRTNVNTWSDGMWKLHGLEPQGRLSSYDVWRGTLSEADRHRTEWAVQNAARLGVDIHLQYRVGLPGGEERWLASRGRAVQDGAGHTIRYLGVVFDVTARHRAEEARMAMEREKLARESETRIRALVSSVPKASFALFDRDLRHVFAAGAALADQGITPADLEGKTIFEANPPEIAAVVEGPLRSALEGTASEFELAVGGRIYWLRAAPVRDPSGGVERVAVASQEITDQRRAEEHRLDTLRLGALQEAIQGLPVGVVLVELGPDGLPRTLARNPASIGFEGAGPGGRKDGVPRFFQADRATPVPPAELAGPRAARTGQPVLGEELAILGDDGHWRHLISSAAPLPPVTPGGPPRAVVVALDVTSRREAEAALRASERRLEESFAASTDGYWELNLGTEQLFQSARLAEIVGLPATDRHVALGEWIARVHPEDRPALAALFQPSLLAGQQARFDVEYRTLHADGSWRWIRSRGRVVDRDETGRPIRIAGTVTDVHQWRTAQDALEASEAKFRGLYESLADGFARVHPDGPILEFNEVYRRMLGYEADELRRMTYLELTPKAWHAMEARIIEDQVIPRGYSEVYEKEYRRKDGSVFPVELRTFSQTDPAFGRTFWAIVRDISERKRAEVALRSSEARFHAMAELAPIGVFRTGADPYLNGAGRRIVGVPLGDDSPTRWIEAVHPADRERVIREWTDAVGTRKPFRSECRAQRPDGTVAWVGCFASPVEDGSDAPSYVGVLIDETEERALRAQLDVASRLAALGTLVGGIAHEMNNPLAGTLANEGFALEELREIRGSLRRGEPLRPEEIAGQIDEIADALEGAQVGAQRVAGIVRELVTLSRPDSRRGRVSLLDVVEQAMRWVPSSASAGARVTIERGSSPDVLAAAGQLEQVVVSLIANASQAARPGQQIQVTVRTGRTPEGGALLEVVDDGEGMAPEVLARAFDPFFTTRPVGSGKGLGLSVAHAIVTAHGGKIPAASAPGKGTTLRVELPAMPAEAPGA